MNLIKKAPFSGPFLYLYGMIDRIKERFEYYNALIFGGGLPTPAFRVTNARRTMGSLRYKTGLLGRHYDFVLCMSKAFNLSESESDDVLIHEMIHLEILSGSKRDTSAHGRLFRERMAQINRDYGRHVTVSRRLPDGILKPDERVRTHYVCLCTLPDGRKGICVTTAKHVAAFKRALPRLYDIKDVEWFETQNPYYNSLPHSVKPRLYVHKGDCPR